MAAARVPSGSAQPASTIPPPLGPAPWKTVWLDHISYGVSDYRRSTAFYRDLMSWEVKSDNRRSQCSMTIGNIGGIIIRNNRRAAGVINHVSWGIEPWDTERVKAELERRGFRPRPDMVGENFKSFHVKDPDGWDLQISNQRDAAVVKDLAAAIIAPSCTVRLAPDAGHMVHFDQPDIVRSIAVNA